MISDLLTTFAANVALNTGAAGNYNIGDVIDTGDTLHRINDVDDLYLVVLVDTAATSGGSATGQFSLLASAASDMSSPDVIVSSAAIPVASMTAGARLLAVALPKGSSNKRYLGIRQTTGTAAFTAGSITAFLTRNVNTWRAFADALPNQA